MEIQRLRYFQSVAKLQHMTRAAVDQGVAQPSLSKSIRLLEEELGTTLFDRKGRGLTLNSRGRAFLNHVETAFRALEDGKRELADLETKREVQVVVAAVALHWAAGLFKAFAAQRPEVKFRLMHRTPAEMLRQLARREVDLCLIVNPRAPEVEWEPLVSGCMYVMVPPGHKLQGRGEATLEQVRNEPFIVPRTGGPVRDLMEERFRQMGLTPNIVCESNDVLAMSELVNAGLGVQFLPLFNRTSDSEPAPSFLRLTEPEIRIEVGIATQRGGYRSRAAQDFAAFAVTYFTS